jgi:putative addiction module component (TIGR02574 family)
MNERVRKFAEQVAELPPADRVALVEGILASLDATDPAIDVAWTTEGRDRLAAYDAGELAAHDFDEVLRARCN